MTVFKEKHIDNLTDFINYGKTLGTLIKSRKNGGLLDVLIPKEKDEAKQNSLSKIYGIDEFPFHTDCAYLKTPPKFILLRYIGDIVNPSPTLVKQINFDILNTQEIDFLFNSIWLVKGQGNSFYSKIIANGIFRFDNNIMTLSSPVENIINQILSKTESKIIEWKKNKTVLIDNWTCLHSRPAVREDEKQKRIIERLNIAYE